ncbi:MAG: histidine phosphatase family protein [Candidatus Krumholzibacteria bacterium]|nr:histidine phosphatase family protein [Candidatus Krumholzibacteria bacterium]
MDEPRRVHLVRHGESTYNAVRRVQGNGDGIGLSETGRRQARMLGERLRSMVFERAFCSSAERALETARLALGEDFPLELRDELREIGFGEWEGLLVEDVRARFPGELDLWFRAPSSVSIAGAEPYEDFYRRALGAVEGILAATGGDVLIVTHGGIICAWLTHVLGMSPDDIWSFSLPNASLTTVVIDFKPRLRLLGDVSHIDASVRGFDGMPSPAQR